MCHNPVMSFLDTFVNSKLMMMLSKWLTCLLYTCVCKLGLVCACYHEESPSSPPPLSDRESCLPQVLGYSGFVFRSILGQMESLPNPLCLSVLYTKADAPFILLLEVVLRYEIVLSCPIHYILWPRSTKDGVCQTLSWGMILRYFPGGSDKLCLKWWFLLWVGAIWRRWGEGHIGRWGQTKLESGSL